MKEIIFLLIGLAAVAVQGYVPSCNLSEMGLLWANTFENTKFWQCSQRDQPPALRACIPNWYWFSYYHQQCVHPEHWIRLPPTPTNVPDRFVPQCTLEQMGLLWPNYNFENKFWQCNRVNEKPAARECMMPDQLFSYYHQQCVHKSHWIGLPKPAFPA